MRLVLMRHAKSSWDDGAQTDHARTLNERGRRDAPVVGAELARRGWVPDAVMASDSARTRETWERMAKAMPPVPRVAFVAALYHGRLGALQAVGDGVGPGVGTLLVLGHNPGLEEAASWLTGLSIGLATANAVLLTHQGAAWGDALADAGGWRLEATIRPKELSPP